MTTNNGNATFYRIFFRIRYTSGNGSVDFSDVDLTDRA